MTCKVCRIEGSVETQSHIIYCQAYQHLRGDVDMESDKGLVKYYRDVMSIRSRMSN